MFLSITSISSQGVSLCDRVLVGPVKESCSFSELFGLFVARHVGDTACSQLVERCSFYNLQADEALKQVVQSPTETPIEVLRTFNGNAVKFVLRTPNQSCSAASRPSAFDRLMEGSRVQHAKMRLPALRSFLGLRVRRCQLTSDCSTIYLKQLTSGTCSEYAVHVYYCIVPE